MTHNKMLNRLPSVSITSNRNELKLYERVIYLNDGDNFELRFFNPLNEKIGVEIVFNGIRKGDGYLILNPGQDITLDRFLDEQRKMVYQTYLIDGNNKDAVDAIENNGEITFNFYKEKTHKIQTRKVYTKSIYDGFLGDYTNNTIINNPANYSSTTRCIYNSTTTDGLFSSITNDLGTKSFETERIETGRVEMGEESTQRLTTVNLDFERISFYSLSYKIKPRSTMNKTVKEIREYCVNCGYRLRNEKWKYCPKCGSNIE